MAEEPETPDDFISSSISEFRNKILNRGGIQLASRYMVEFYTPYGNFVTYPTELNIPQRALKTFDVGQPLSLWGTSRKIPVQQEYDECTMSFVVYEDWQEKTFFDQWMNNIINVAEYDEDGEPERYEYANIYFDWIGKVYINTFSSAYQPSGQQSGGRSRGRSNPQFTSKILLDEAYPLSLLPISMTAEATGYTTFVLNMAYRKSYMLPL